MAYAGSYLWRLRQAVGHELVLMPGAMVAVQRDDGQVLLAKRADDGSWCLPAGGAEVGGSFARTAIDELAEETGIEVVLEDLLPFASLSDAPELERTVAGLGNNVSEVREAVQPGRRIATLRRSAGLALPVALITPP